MPRLLLIAIVLAAAALIAVKFGVDSELPHHAVITDSPLSLAIADKVAAGRNVDLLALAPFAWDRLHVFAPYSTPETIEAAVGSAWPGVAGSDIGTLDSITLLVFVDHGLVVHAFDHPRAAGDFSAVATGEAIVPSDARFAVSADSPPDAPQLEHLSSGKP